MALPTIAMQQEATPIYKVCKAVTPPNENDEIIFYVPDGELTFFSRNCTEFANDYWEGLKRNDIKGSVVRQVSTADGTLYFSNPLADFTMLSYLKGSYDSDGSIVIEGPQFVYDEYDDWTEEVIKMYMLPMKRVVNEEGKGTYMATDDMKYVLKKTDTGYEAADPEILLGLAAYGELADMDGNPTGETGYAWMGYGESGIQLTAHAVENGVTPPADAVLDKWVFKDPYETALIGVALHGDDIYIQGIDRGVQDAWVKGKISDGKVTIPSGSYIGINPTIAYYSYLWGTTIEYEYDEDEEIMKGSPNVEAVFEYDAEGKKLELVDGYAICSMPEDFYLLTIYEDVEIYGQERNINTPPANPYELEVEPWDDYFEAGRIAFRIPVVDNEGCVLETDRLYYRIYIDGEVYIFTSDEYPHFEIENDMVNMPYGQYDNWDIFCSGNYHEIFFHFELPEEGCGVQSVYINEEGKELCSEIVTGADSGVNSTRIHGEEASCTFYNLQGHVVDPTCKGPVICRIVYKDGTVKTIKTMRVGK